MFFLVFEMNVTTHHTNTSSLNWKPSIKSFRVTWRSAFRATKCSILTHFSYSKSPSLSENHELYICSTFSQVMCCAVQHFTQPFYSTLAMKQVTRVLIFRHPPSLGGGGSLEGRVKPNQNQCTLSSINNQQHLINSR